MNKFLQVFNRLIALWVIIFGIIAFFFPKAFIIFKNSINIFFSFAMLGIGLVLKEEDYLNILKTPGHVLFGTVCQFVIMPSMALITSYVFNLPLEWKIGLIITGAAPGAMTSNVISYLSKADTAYSISLTTLSTILCPLLTPLITYWIVHTHIPVNFWSMFKTILFVVVIPLIVGFIIRKIFSEYIDKIGEMPSAISVISIVFITSYVIAANKERLGYATLIVILAVAFHNGMGMFLGYIAGYIIKLSHIKRKTLSIEVGMQNAGLGVILALKHFGKDVAIPAAIFTVWCILTASFLVYFWKIVEKSS